MKRKDLVVGTDVAVKDGYNVDRAYILELDTRWAYTYFDGHHQRHPMQNSAQVAVAMLNPNKTWRPAVIASRQILMSWSDYEAQQRERDDRERKYKAEQVQRDQYEKLRSRCAELLGCAVTSSRLGYAEVSLNDLYAALKGLKD